MVIGSIRLVELGIKSFVFPEADKYEIYITPETKPEPELRTNQENELKRMRQREFSSAFAMIVVGLPVYLYHWKTIQKEKKG